MADAAIKQKAVILVAGILGLVGIGGLIIGAIADAQGFAVSYLWAYFFWLSLPLGAMAFIAIHNLTGGAWGEPLRAPLAASASTLPIMALLFIPLVPVLGQLWPWASAEKIGLSHTLQQRLWYLNREFFYLRTGLDFGAWLVFSFLFGFAGNRRVAVSALAGIALGLSLTVGAIDLLMSLQPEWDSSIFGMAISSGILLSGFAAVLALGRFTHGSEWLSPERSRDAGGLLMMLVLLWIYLNFSQYLVIWWANLPKEITWYVARLNGGWQWLALAIVALHGVVPFFVLLIRSLKERFGFLSFFCLGLLVIHAFNILWLVAPTFRSGFAVTWEDFAAFFAIGGMWMVTFLIRLGPATKLEARHAA